MVGLGCDISPRSLASQCKAEGSVYLEEADELANDPLNPTVVDITVISNTQTTGELQLGENGVGWSGCGVDSAPKDVTDIVFYGMARKPAKLIAQPGNVEITPTEDIRDPNAYYDANSMRLQVTNLNMTFCDLDALSLTWDFNEE